MTAHSQLIFSLLFKMPPPAGLGLEIKIVTLVTGTLLILGLGSYLYSPDQSASLPVLLADQPLQLGSSTPRSSEEGLNSTDLDDDDDELSYRLPKDLIPIKYTLKLQPIIPVLPGVYDSDDSNESSPLEAHTLYSIPGQVTITFRCVGRTSRIVLHQSGITIHEDEVKVFKSEENGVTPIDPSSLPIKGHSYETKQDFYTIELNEALEEGQVYSVFIPFTSYLSRANTVGIFVVEFNDSTLNRTKHMVTTKFQATHARQGFPCFDEPEFKATFEIIVGRTKGYHSLSNWPLRETVEDQNSTGWYWDYFQPTTPMSAYLVCFAVSDFAYAEADVPLSGNRPVKVWAPKHIIDKGGGKYGANLTAKVIKLLEEYFDRADILPKVDSIMVPNFMTPAMENWGLITYKEDMIIYTPEDSTDRFVVVTTVVAHELSHHWFGNLVTCDWWSDVWLNEGFATFLSYEIMEGLDLNIDPEHMFVENVLQFTMTSDSQPSVRPVHAEVKTPAEVYEMFGTTAYRKGASIIRMVKNFLGSENFKQALRNFMRRFEFKTATQDDLFVELDEVCENCLPSGITMKEVMEPWTLLPGYPTIRADRLNDTTIRLTQQPFLLTLGEHDTTEERRWWIPLRVTTKNDPKSNSVVWIAPNMTSLTLEVSSPGDWVHLNTHYAGYFSVAYDLQLSIALQEQLERDHLVFSAVTRCQILFDHVGAAKANHIPGEAVLNMTRYLHKETDPLPWTALYYYLHDLQRYLRLSPPHIEAFTRYMMPKIETVLASPDVGMQAKNDESYMMDNFRYSLLRIVCRFGSEVCFDEARRMFREAVEKSQNPFEGYKNGAEDVLRCAMVRVVGAEAWELVLKTFLSSQDRSVHWLALRAMACVQTDELVDRTLDLACNTTLLTDVTLRSGLLGNLLRNKYAATKTLSFLFHHVALPGEEPSDESKFIPMEDFGRLLTTLSEYPPGLDVIERLRGFAEEKQAALVGTSMVGDAIRMMEEFAAWMEHYGDLYLDWFNANS